MDEHRKKSIKALIVRRRALQDAYDALISEPQSYGITGSVNATNQRLSDLRAEISALDTQIRAALTHGGIISRALPDYFGGGLI